LTIPANEALREIFETRFKGYDEAIRLLQDAANNQPTTGVISERLIALDRIVELRFNEWNVRTDALAVSNQKSIDLALQAAKEAAAKSEGAVNKQIDSLNARIDQSVTALATRLNDIKESVTILGARGEGSKQTNANMTTVISIIIAAVSLGILAVKTLGGTP
jgi:hypothetical protein